MMMSSMSEQNFPPYLRYYSPKDDSTAVENPGITTCDDEKRDVVFRLL